MGPIEGRNNLYRLSYHLANMLEKNQIGLMYQAGITLLLRSRERLNCRNNRLLCPERNYYSGLNTESLDHFPDYFHSTLSQPTSEKFDQNRLKNCNNLCQRRILKKVNFWDFSGQFLHPFLHASICLRHIKNTLLRYGLGELACHFAKC